MGVRGTMSPGQVWAAAQRSPRSPRNPKREAFKKRSLIVVRLLF